LHEREKTRELVTREREGEEKEGERERESLRRVARASQGVGRRRGRKRDEVGGTPRLIHSLCTLL